MPRLVGRMRSLGPKMRRISPFWASLGAIITALMAVVILGTTGVLGPADEADKPVPTPTPRQIPRPTSAPRAVPTPPSVRVPLPTPTPVPVLGNLVRNGDFEGPDAGARWVTIVAGKGFDGWTVGTGSVDVTGTFWETPCGKQSLDLAGQKPGTMYQDLATVPGQKYLLLFRAAGNPAGGQPVKKMELWWGPGMIDTVTFDTTGRTVEDMGWRPYRYEVVAHEKKTRLAFRSAEGGTHWGVVLDCVEVFTPQGLAFKPTPTPLPTPTPTPIPPPTPTPAPPPVIITMPVREPSGERPGGNEIVSRREVSEGLELWPGNLYLFEATIGGCGDGCRRSVDVQFFPSQGELRTEMRLDSVLGAAVREGDHFGVPSGGIHVFVFVWANPGTERFRLDRINLQLNEDGREVDVVEVARKVTVPESILAPLSLLQEVEGVVRGSIRIENKTDGPQTIKFLKIENCAFPGLCDKARLLDGDEALDPDKEFLLEPGKTVLGVRITVPAGEEILPGTLFGQFTFKRVLQKHVLTPNADLVPK